MIARVFSINNNSLCFSVSRLWHAAADYTYRLRARGRVTAPIPTGGLKNKRATNKPQLPQPAKYFE